MFALMIAVCLCFCSFQFSFLFHSLCCVVSVFILLTVVFVQTVGLLAFADF